MKQTLLLACCTLILISCGTGKRSHRNDEINPAPIETDLTDQIDDLNDKPDNALSKGAISSSAIIRDKSVENCGFLLEIIQENELKLFEPLDLPELFRVDGIEVNVTYRLSRRPSTCGLALPIIIDKIEVK